MTRLRKSQKIATQNETEVTSKDFYMYYNIMKKVIHRPDDASSHHVTIFVTRITPYMSFNFTIYSTDLEFFHYEKPYLARPILHMVNFYNFIILPGIW